MDSLLPLLLFVVFFLFKALGNRKAQPRAPQPGQPEASDRTVPAARDADMDEALRQIREALGMPTAPPTPAPAPPPLPPAPPRPTPPPRRSTEFRERPPSFSEEAFERKRDTFVPPHKAPHMGTKGVPPPPPIPRKTPTTEPLLQPETAEQAFLYAEVFGRPRSQRRLRG